MNAAFARELKEKIGFVRYACNFVRNTPVPTETLFAQSFFIHVRPSDRGRKSVCADERTESIDMGGSTNPTGLCELSEFVIQA